MLNTYRKITPLRQTTLKSCMQTGYNREKSTELATGLAKGLAADLARGLAEGLAKGLAHQTTAPMLEDARFHAQAQTQ